jgi:hypothetical protein
MTLAPAKRRRQMGIVVNFGGKRMFCKPLHLEQYRVLDMNREVQYPRHTKLFKLFPRKKSIAANDSNVSSKHDFLDNPKTLPVRVSEKGLECVNKGWRCPSAWFGVEGAFIFLLGAKIICLVGPLSHPVSCETYKKEFELAEQLAIMDHPFSPMKLIDRGNWRKELKYIPDPTVPQDLLDSIEFLLIIDPDKRPTASKALRHPYLQSVATDKVAGKELEKDGWQDTGNSKVDLFSVAQNRN